MVVGSRNAGSRHRPGVAGGGGARDGKSFAPATAALPNIVVVMSDDQTVESMRVMSNVRTLLAGAGNDVRDASPSYPLCCPSRVDVPHRPVLAQPRRARQHAAERRLPGSTSRTRSPSGCSAPATTPSTSASTSTATAGRTRPTSRPAGASGTAPSTRRPTASTTTRSTRTGRSITYGARTRTVVLPDRRLPGKAVEIIRRRAPEAQPFFLSVAFLAPHSGGAARARTIP